MYSPSLKYGSEAVVRPNLLTSSGPRLWNDWFNATICIEKPNTKMASTAKKRAKSFSKSPIMIAHGPNKWWNDKKSKIWTQASKNDKAKHWLRQYISVGQNVLATNAMPATWTPTPAIPNSSTNNLMLPRPDLSLGLVNSNSSRPLSHTNRPHSYQYGIRLPRTTG